MTWNSPSIGEAALTPAASPLAPPIITQMALSPLQLHADDAIQPIDFEEDGTPIYAQPPAPGHALPSGCQRKLALPLDSERAECGWQNNCEGIQRDGGCLCDLVRAEHTAGRSPEFEVDPDGFWVLKKV